MSTIVLHIEDKVRTDFLVVFRRLTSVHAFVGVTLVLLAYFQLDTVIPFVITILLIYAKIMILLIVARHLMPKFIFWISSVASKFDLLL